MKLLYLASHVGELLPGVAVARRLLLQLGLHLVNCVQQLLLLLAPHVNLMLLLCQLRLQLVVRLLNLPQLLLVRLDVSFICEPGW